MMSRTENDTRRSDYVNCAVNDFFMRQLIICVDKRNLKEREREKMVPFMFTIDEHRRSTS